MLKRLLVGVCLVLALPYLRSGVYRFPEPRPFSGPAFQNPYEGLTRSWQRANLHAHGRAWGGLTNGQQPADVLVRRYEGIGYDVPGVSNYHLITKVHGPETLPLYEHGYNLAKTHRLVIGAREVSWFDFPLWQSLSHKQRVIDEVLDSAELVALAHPATGYTLDDLRRLTGYHAIEIVNGPHPAMPYWDAALSSGHAVWGIANDDTHDIQNNGRFGVAWTMIDAPTSSPADIVAALRAGRSYAVWRSNQNPSAVESALADVSFSDGTLRVASTGDAATYHFIGQNGTVKKTVRGVKSASYTFTPEDTYIRTMIQTPRTEMFLNPVFRYNGASVESPRATYDLAGTWSMRGAGLAGFGAIVAGWWLAKRRRVTVRRTDVVAVPVATGEGGPA